MKTTIYGRTGRAQLAIIDMTGPEVPARKRREHIDFCVTLLPRSASRSTSYASAGDRVYVGPSYETALMHIQAWTGVERVELPREMRAVADRVSTANVGEAA